MKKSILPVVVLLASLISGEFISIAPAFAEAADKTVVIAPKDTTTEATNTAPDTTITTSDAPTTEVGSEWSGEITEPAGTNISEPPVPAEAPAPSAPAKAEATTVITTTVPATRPVAAPVNTAPAPATQPEPAEASEPAASTTESDGSNTTGPANTAESTDTTESTDAADSTDAAPYIEVPKTSFAERNRKITLMALISTALVFFSSIFIASAYSLFRLIRSERKQKEHESAVEATIRRHITRAE